MAQTIKEMRENRIEFLITNYVIRNTMEFNHDCHGYIYNHVYYIPDLTTQTLHKNPPHGVKIVECCDCVNLTHLPEDPENFPEELEILNLSGCTGLTRLPETLPKRLLELNLSGCAGLTKLPEKLPIRLRQLNCSGCTGLTRLPETLPKKLQYLYVNGCTGLEELPALPKSLKYLHVNWCTSMISLPDVLPERLTVFGERMVEDNYNRWRQEQCSRYFSVKKKSIVAEELIMKACHPSRMLWYMDWEELKLMGLV